ncbi:MAG TPA: hypothetical protein VKL99_10980 [Candidatus Angelobacter sp.]|nr:hypothetical protein [Candidatus Angelobacter sp.]
MCAPPQKFRSKIWIPACLPGWPWRMELAGGRLLLGSWLFGSWLLALGLLVPGFTSWFLAKSFFSSLGSSLYIFFDFFSDLFAYISSNFFAYIFSDFFAYIFAD